MKMCNGCKDTVVEKLNGLLKECNIDDKVLWRDEYEKGITAGKISLLEDLIRGLNRD